MCVVIGSVRIVCSSFPAVSIFTNITYSNATVQELNPFPESVREPCYINHGKLDESIPESQLNTKYDQINVNN